MDTPRALNVEVAYKLLERAGEKPQKINLSNNGIELVERSALKLIGAGVVKVIVFFINWLFLNICANYTFSSI